MLAQWSRTFWLLMQRPRYSAVGSFRLFRWTRSRTTRRPQWKEMRP